MNVNGALSVQNIYKYNKMTNDNAVTVTSIKASSDTVEISPEATRQAKISSFLKEKPHSSYKYDWMIRNEPDKADEYIDNLMTNYDKSSKSMPPFWPKDKDNYAKNALGYKTVEDVKEGLEEGVLINKVFGIMQCLRDFDETEQTLKVDDKDWYIRNNRPANISGGILSEYREGFLYYKDIKIDPETAEVFFLPNNGNKWLSRDEFEKISPDYKANMDPGIELSLAIEAGKDTGIKYIENFIAGLSEEDREFIKNSNMLGSPAFRNLDIKGLDYFQTSYDKINGVSKRIRLKDPEYMEEQRLNAGVNLMGEDGQITKIGTLDFEARLQKLAEMTGGQRTNTQSAPKSSELKNAIIENKKIMN